MKNIILLICVCLFSSFSYAQNITYSKPIKLNNKTPRFKVLGRNANFFIAERWGSKFHYIDLYNADLKKVSSKELKFDQDKKLKKIWVQPKKGWIIYTEAERDFTKLQAKQIDAKFNIKTKPLLLDSIVERRDLVSDNLRMTTSLNEKFLAVYIPIFSKGKLQYFDIKVYNESLQVYHEMILKDNFVKGATFVDLEVDNDGHAVVVFKDKNSSNEFKIYYGSSNNTVKTHSLSIPFVVFKRLKFNIDNINNKLVVAGFKSFKENKRKETSDAFFTLKVDLLTGAKSNITLETFTKQFFKLLTDRESKTDKVTLQTFYIKSILPKTDGGYLVFAESYYENEEIIEVPQSRMANTGVSLGAGTFMPTTTTYRTNYFHYNDVIVYTLDKNQAIESVNIIKKRQRSEDDNGGYSSFTIVNQQNLLDVLFLDDININSSLKRYTVNGDSELFKDYILNINQNNVMPVVKMALQTAPNEVLIPSYLNNSFSLIKIVFEDNE